MNVLDRLGVEYRVSGDEAIAECPMHEQRTGRADSSPSWSINTDSGLHHCFSCGYRGNLIGLVRDLLGLNSDEAEAWLSEDRPTVEVLKRKVGVVKQRTSPQVFDPAWFNSFDPVPETVRESRGLTARTCERFNLRYRDGWAIPISDLSGQMIGWQHKSQQQVRNHPTGIRKSRTLFGLSFVESTCVVVESPLDAALCDQYGHPCVATFGAMVSTTQVELIARFYPTLAFDNDEAGRQATAQVSNDLQRRGVRHRIVQWPAHLKDFGDDPSAIRSLVEQAVDPVVDRARRMPWY